MTMSDLSIVPDAALRQVIEQWEAALSRKDAEAIVRGYAQDVVVYDVGTQLTGPAALKTLWEQCFPYFGQSIGFERKDTVVHLSGDLAVMRAAWNTPSPTARSRRARSTSWSPTRPTGS